MWPAGRARLASDHGAWWSGVGVAGASCTLAIDDPTRDIAPLAVATWPSPAEHEGFAGPLVWVGRSDQRHVAGLSIGRVGADRARGRKLGAWARVGVGPTIENRLALLVHGLLIPDGGDVHVPAGELFGYGERAFQVLLEGQKVPDLGRHGDRGQQRHRLPVHHRLLRCRLHQLRGQLEDRLAAP
jgi:hypothetical protein